MGALLGVSLGFLFAKVQMKSYGTTHVQKPRGGGHYKFFAFAVFATGTGVAITAVHFQYSGAGFLACLFFTCALAQFTRTPSAGDDGDAEREDQVDAVRDGPLPPQTLGSAGHSDAPDLELDAMEKANVGVEEDDDFWDKEDISLPQPSAAPQGGQHAATPEELHHDHAVHKDTEVGMEKDTNIIEQVCEVLSFIWELIAEPLLFSVIGSVVDVRRLNFPILPRATVLILACVFCVRVPVAMLAVGSCGLRAKNENFMSVDGSLTRRREQGPILTLKERLFIGLSWMPKATVQAALGSVPLDRVKFAAAASTTVGTVASTIEGSSSTQGAGGPGQTLATSPAPTTAHDFFHLGLQKVHDAAMGQGNGKSSALQLSGAASSTAAMPEWAATGEAYGEIIVTTAVLSILLTAPLGLLVVSKLGPRMLTKDDVMGREEYHDEEGSSSSRTIEMTGSTVVVGKRILDGAGGGEQGTSPGASGYGVPE
ncbi:unnamed protein product [Amoebophrya sp. A25]|nr:unnamed protein product [Amoebophrya sp. A25]|eukprot:GSA25T00020507001.1